MMGRVRTIETMCLYHLKEIGPLILIDVHLATPHYNTTLLCEMGSMDRHLHTIYSATEDFPGMADAIALCKVWARQRGLDKVRGQGKEGRGSL